MKIELTEKEMRVIRFWANESATDIHNLVDGYSNLNDLTADNLYAIGSEHNVEVLSQQIYEKLDAVLGEEL